jgi:hypothetical protein
VSQVTGSIRSIDGKAVQSLGSSFELLPGCHIVELDPTPKSNDYVTVFALNPQPVVFAIVMKKGHIYQLRHDYVEQMGSVRLIVEGDELDSRGMRVQRFGPARSREELERCVSGSAAARNE